MSLSQSLLKAGTPYRPTQVMPSQIDIEEVNIDLVDSSTGKGLNGIGWGEQGQLQNTANTRRGLVYQFIIERRNIGGSRRNISSKRSALRPC